MSGALQKQEKLHTDKRAQNKDFAVGKINKFQNTVHHGIAEGDQRVHKTQDDAVHENLREDFECQLQLLGSF
jgi:hypothetical protein